MAGEGGHEVDDPDIDVLVIGAGVVGLAVAAELATGSRVAVVERHESYARETSSHNSGVIHSGIYYPTGSWKHRLSLEGNAALYDWCAEYGVPHRRLGKLIVATEPGDLEMLDQLETQARANEVPGISRLTGAEARALEPAVPALGAVLSPTTGIVDAVALARSFESVARAASAIVLYRTQVLACAREHDVFHVKLLEADGTESTLRCRALVNAAGHGAPAIAGSLGYPADGDGDTPSVRQHLSRGRYYDVVDRRISRRVRRLVYPAPAPQLAGLGVHVTIDLDGAMHLGPDAEWMAPNEPLDYRNDDSRRAEFLAAARRLLPDLRAEDIAPGQVGYRPKLSGPGEAPADFLIWHDRGYVHLGGIESPGLTASIPIARQVAGMLRSEPKAATLIAR